MTLGGTLFVHNAIEYDYCVGESLLSLFLVCDEVVVVDAGSTDGTREYLKSLPFASKVRVVEAAWNPVVGAHGAHLADLANLARSHLTTPYHFSLQADEVLYEVDYPTLRKYAEAGTAITVQRLNFWLNARSVAGHGHLCGCKVIRGAPTQWPLIGDAENITPDCGAVETPIRLFHAGFLRRRASLIAKSINQETAFWGGYNPVFDALRENASALDSWVPSGSMAHYDGPYPALLVPWLQARGRL